MTSPEEGLGTMTESERQESFDAAFRIHVGAPRTNPLGMGSVRTILSHHRRSDGSRRASRSRLRDARHDRSRSEYDAEQIGASRQVRGKERRKARFRQMVSEYRALRASVIRLWINTAGELARQDLDDLVRFNESIDQALAESTSRFTKDRVTVL